MKELDFCPLTKGRIINPITKIMKYLKINIEENADPEVLKNIVLQLKGVASAEIVDEENPESELKKAFAKTKEQLKTGDYENLVNDIFDIIIKNNSKIIK
ncbi:hypothetical protein [Chryseobacterium sp. CH25]|uniref:hypothetical protein n=1 Tax=Chryseobacterium sp. CH25 TaxID=713559 RepID=UPI001E4674E0|nr:hypothetical protein [Chryseobacterium sp. CH25]